MPLVEVTLGEGRAPEQIRALLSAVTDAVVSSIGAPKDTVRVVVREVPLTHWSAGGVTLAERTAYQAAGATASAAPAGTTASGSLPKEGTAP